MKPLLDLALAAVSLAAGGGGAFAIAQVAPQYAGVGGVVAMITVGLTLAIATRNA